MCVTALKYNNERGRESNNENPCMEIKKICYWIKLTFKGPLWSLSHGCRLNNTIMILTI
jgi:hypothetical protein